MKETDRLTLEMALVGYEAERQRIEAAMAALRRQIGGRVVGRATVNGSGPKRILSVVARRRIAAAQRKRWAAFHANQNAATKTAPKGKLSAVVKAKLARNLAKARAAKAARAKRVAAAA
jgi:hypothetical protein